MRVGIIGAGIVGLALAHRLQLRYPHCRIHLFEKERRTGKHQSTHNSGVLHAGLYYKPGSFKAKLSVEGIRLMKDFCAENSIAHEECGKLVVATNDLENSRLDNLFERGKANGLQGLEVLSREEMLEIEPHVGGVRAIRVPEEGIVDYRAVCDRLEESIVNNGGQLLLGHEAQGLCRKSGVWLVRTPLETFEMDFVVSAAGLQSDRVGALSGEARRDRIVPFRGEYYEIKKERAHLVRNLIYPVPDPGFPFLGVHFTRLIHGGIEAGPNAVLAFAREGYRMSQLEPADLADSLGFSGLWRFMGKHWQMCASELWRSFSKAAFCRSLQRLVPEIQVEDLAPGGAGVRAQAMSPGGTLLQDFVFKRQEAMLHVLNAPSPAATASLAIADSIISEMSEYLEN